jgi:hypothetical protein
MFLAATSLADYGSLVAALPLPCIPTTYSTNAVLPYSEFATKQNIHSFRFSG